MVSGESAWSMRDLARRRKEQIQKSQAALRPDSYRDRAFT